MKKSIVYLLFLSSITRADNKSKIETITFNSIDSFGKAVGSEAGKAFIATIKNAYSNENALKKANAQIKLKRKELAIREQEERLHLVKTLRKLNQQEQKRELSDEEITQRDNIKLCLAVLIQKQEN